MKNLIYRVIPKCVAVFLLLIVGLSQAAMSADVVPLADWLKLGPEAARNWLIVEDDENPMQAVITPRKLQSDKKYKRVMIIYPRASPAYDTALNRLLDVFHEREVYAQFVVVNFQNNPIQGKQAIVMAKRLWVDLIFSMGSEATDFMVANFKNGNIPTVSICSKDPVLLGQIADYEKGSGTHFAFTSLNMQIDAQLAYLLELKPKLKNIGILVDAKNKSAVQTQAEPIAKAARDAGIHPIDIVVKDPTAAAVELLQKIPLAVDEMRKTDPTLRNSVFWITGSTSVFKEIAAINSVADKVPVISVVPEVASEGDASAVLSIGISFDSNAYLAAIYGTDILMGKAKPGSLKVGIVSPPDIAINFRKASQIGLKIPFSFFERAGFVYDYEGRPVRLKGITQKAGK